jgi:hypothetical protein
VSSNISKKTTFYKKEGRRYVPVHEYDSELSYSLPTGNHLIMCYPGGSSTRHNIDPNYAALIAAARLAEDVMSTAISKAGELRLQSKLRNRPLTPEQKDAWDNLVKVFGDDAKQLEWPSLRECAEAGVSALIDEANKLMKHESVKLAYEHFLLTCELTKEHK